MPKKSKALREIAAMKHEAEAALTRATVECRLAESQLDVINKLEEKLERQPVLKAKKPSKAREQTVKQFNDEAAKVAFEKMRAAANTQGAELE